MYRTKKDIDKQMVEKYGEDMNPNTSSTKKPSKKGNDVEADQTEDNKSKAYETLNTLERDNIKRIAKYLEIKPGKKHTDTLIDEIIEEVGEDKAIVLAEKSLSKDGDKKE